MDSSESPKTAAEVFEKNTIPGVRVIEQQLRANISRNRERLRGLVGGNYRDLLSTADEIVLLNQRAKEAELQISDLSRRCKPPQHSSTVRPVATISSISAQLRLLTQCITCASAALNARSVLLCAELTVISRLLLKSLSEEQTVPTACTSLRNKAATLRRRLLRLIRSQLAHPASKIEALVNAICAYCLVTSASSNDAVEHFRTVRLEKLRQRVESEDHDPSRVKEDFRYLVVSLQMLKSILGRSVNDALSALQKHPILQDEHVARLEALDIDRLRNLIPADILEFTPYIKRVLLKQEEVQQISSSWVRDACQVFEKGLRDALRGTKDVADVLALRKDLLSVILPVYFSTPALETLLNTVREVGNARVVEISKAQIGELTQIGEGIIVAQQGIVESPSLWHPALVQQSLSSRGKNYARQVQSSHLGTKGELATSLRKMRKWTRQIGELRNQFQMLQSIRWQDALEEPDDDDEDHAQDIVRQLSKDDPDGFKKAVDQALNRTISDYNDSVRAVVTKAIEGQSESDESSVSRIVYLLRVLRESSAILNHSTATSKLEINGPVTQLQTALADLVTKRIMSSALQAKDGSPSSDTSHQPDDLPSPQAFKFLQDICKVLADVGGADVWSEAAVSSFKQKLSAEIFKDERPAFFCNDFDEHYVGTALATQDKSQVKADSKQDDAKSKAQAYWLRTRLLFGVLSS